jgi:RNA polymerase sigma factor (sigma-70 family)
MSIHISKATLDGIDTLFRWGAIGTRSDAELIALFSSGAHEREAAFRILIHRHGPMVLGICRRVLRNEHAAEDAFQATFLVLVKKAGSLRDTRSLRSWLFGVAQRVADKERVKGARRRIIERQAAGRTESDGSDLVDSELRVVIDEEIRRLPDRYRLPLILCQLEGLPHQEVAQRLGCPVGTIESRLSRAKQRLRDRLERRGLAPTASALLVAALRGRADCAVPPELLKASVQALTARSVRPLASSAAWATASSAVKRGVLLTQTIPGALVLSIFLIGAGVVATRLGVDSTRGAQAAAAANPLPMPSTKQAQAKTADGARSAAASNPLEALAPFHFATSVQAPNERKHPNATRATFAFAHPLRGITIDGNLDDWPKNMPRYPISRQLVDLSPYDASQSKESVDQEAYFNVGYDRDAGLIYLAVVVHDHDIVTHPTDAVKTDSSEIYIDGTFSNRSIGDPSRYWADEVDARTMPALQYAGVPAPIAAYGDPREANPSLLYGDIRKTTTKMKYRHTKGTIIYEWAVQPFDQYPRQPGLLYAGKRLGLEVAVVDKDHARTRPTFLTWGPPPVRFKGCDAGSLGELILEE